MVQTILRNFRIYKFMPVLDIVKMLYFLKIRENYILALKLLTDSSQVEHASFFLIIKL